MMSFTSHGALVCGDLVGLNEETISRYFHSFIDVNNVSNEDEVLMDICYFPVTLYCYYFSRLCLLV